MKNFYTTLFLLFSILILNAQTFDFSLAYIGINGNTNNHQLALVATPSSSVTNGNTADMGAGFYVPSGLTIGNFVMGDSGIPASEWSSQTLGASNSNGDPYFVSRSEAGSSSVIIDGDGPFQLILFDLIADPNPTSGEIKFVENGDPVFNEILFIQNYFNINLGSGTDDAYNQNNPNANSIDFGTLSTEESKLLTGISVYPNPTTDRLFINSVQGQKLKMASLYNITGKVVLTRELTGYNNRQELNLKSLPTGLYLLKLESNTASVVKKIVKK